MAACLLIVFEGQKAGLPADVYVPYTAMSTATIFFVMALVLGVQTLVKYFCGQAAEGFSTVILLILITGACILLGVGVIGYYLSKIYEEIKQRPRYIISRTAGGKGSDNGN